MKITRKEMLKLGYRKLYNLYRKDLPDKKLLSNLIEEHPLVGLKNISMYSLVKDYVPYKSVSMVKNIQPHFFEWYETVYPFADSKLSAKDSLRVFKKFERLSLMFKEESEGYEIDILAIYIPLKIIEQEVHNEDYLDWLYLLGEFVEAVFSWTLRVNKDYTVFEESSESIEALVNICILDKDAFLKSLGVD